jgi:hypothetical protein
MFFFASWMPLTKSAGSGARSGSVSQSYGSEDLNPHLDPYQNATDPEHWREEPWIFPYMYYFSMVRVNIWEFFHPRKIQLVVSACGLQQLPGIHQRTTTHRKQSRLSAFWNAYLFAYLCQRSLITYDHFLFMTMSASNETKHYFSLPAKFSCSFLKIYKNSRNTYTTHFFL